MRIAITGAKGMLGRDLAVEFSRTPGAHELSLLDHSCDITDPRAVSDSLTRPQVVIHAAAYTDVDGCEGDPERAMRVNGQGTANVARAAAEAGARLFYISTDYVFDGTKREPYLPDDPPNPRSVYGRSKLAGETAVLAHPHSLVVRTAWLYGLHGRHFVGAILEKARRGEPLGVVDDQIGSPTWTRDLARALLALLATEARGIVHATGSGCCSWFEFAQAIVEEAGSRVALPPVRLEPISSAELSRPAPRPAYSVLSDARLRELGVAPLPEWRRSLRCFLGVMLRG